MNPPADGDGLDDLVKVWWSRYCPTCSGRYDLSRTVCPEDGTDLRDLSIVTSWDALPGAVTDWDSTSAHLSGLFPPLGRAEQVPPPLIIGGKWRIEDRKSHGTFGDFYNGHHLILEMKVGIKVLRSRFTSTEAGRLMFHQEAMRVSRLNHPNIVKVFDFGQEGETLYLVMEYLSGHALQCFWGREDFSLDDGVEVLRQACLALIAAHEGAGTGEPLVHLDLKPEHIFLEKIGDRWHVKVIDFGLAEIFSTPVDGGESDGGGKEGKKIAGTLPYMAPERWKSVADPRCDIYSLGIILYELVAGRKPFMGVDPETWRKLHETEVPKPPSLHRTGGRQLHLRELDSIVLRCLEKDPEKRYPSVEALSGALEKWQKRPRHGPLGRALRVAAVPAMVLFLMLGGLYWAPWETLDVSGSLLLGPKTKLRLNLISSGMGYRGGRAEILLEIKKNRYAIPMSWDGSSYEVGWPDLIAALGAEPGVEERCPSTVVLRGKFGRSVRSKPIEITLDARPPRIARVEGAEMDGEDLWMLGRSGAEFYLQADELLDSSGCTVNGDSATAVEGGRAIRFRIHKEAQEKEQKVLIVLCDGVRNSASYPFSAKWVEEPRLDPDQKRQLFTNQSLLKLPLRILGRCAKIEVDGKPPREISPDGDATVFEHELQFPPEKGARQSAKVKVRLWSELSSRRGRDPEEDAEIQVEFLSRPVKVVPEEAADRSIPRGFRLEDGDGRRIPPDQVRWSPCQLHLVEGEKTIQIVARIDQEGRLETQDFKGVTGMLRLLVQGQDLHGNESPIWSDEYPLSSPRIRDFGIIGEDGTERKPLLHKDCPLRDFLVEMVPSFRLSADIDYPDQRRLTFEFYINNPGSGSSPLPVQIVQGQCQFAEDKLLDLLSPGENKLFLVARDAEQLQRSSPASCSVWYCEPLSVKVLPEDNKPLLESDVPEGWVKVNVEVTGGPTVKDVLIEEKPASKGESNSCEREVEVPRAGPTKVDIRVRFEGDYEYSASLEYCRAPAHGFRYVFPAGGGLGDLEVEYRKGEAPRAGMWITPLDTWPSLLGRFRMFHARAGTPKAASGSERGASRGEARDVAAWISVSLKNVKLLGPDGQVDLPTRKQLEAILQAGPQESREEWLSDPSRKIHELKDLPSTMFKDAFAKWDAGSLKLFGAEPEEQHPFRLVILESGEGDGLAPLGASRCFPRPVTPKPVAPRPVTPKRADHEK